MRIKTQAVVFVVVVFVVVVVVLVVVIFVFVVFVVVVFVVGKPTSCHKWERLCGLGGVRTRPRSLDRSAR